MKIMNVFISCSPDLCGSLARQPRTNCPPMSRAGLKRNEDPVGRPSKEREREMSYAKPMICGQSNLFNAKHNLPMLWSRSVGRERKCVYMAIQSG